MQFKILPKFSRVLIPPSTCIIFVSSATYEIKNTSKCSTRTVAILMCFHVFVKINNGCRLYDPLPELVPVSLNVYCVVDLYRLLIFVSCPNNVVG